MKISMPGTALLCVALFSVEFSCRSTLAAEISAPVPPVSVRDNAEITRHCLGFYPTCLRRRAEENVPYGDFLLGATIIIQANWAPRLLKR